jgi:tetratricopeptide (TPR) repeat protein
LQIANSTVPKAFYFQVIEGKVITKEVRYWHSKMGLRFENPIYESIDCPSAEFLEDVIIYSAKKKTDSAMPLIKHWKETKPAAIQPYYYEACALLLEQKFEDFTRVARYYLMHNTDNTMSAIMLKYYLAMVDLYVLEEYKDIIPNLMHCIASNPLMAEFWCLLGDLSYKAQDYGKAIAFYENAIILGSRRLKKDWWPLEIDKYKKHPERMIANCQKIMNETKILVRK